MKKLLKEFKEFALKGSMVDLAIGLIIGASFSKAVSSLVSDILMPPIGLLLGGVDFSKLALNLHLPGSSKPPVSLRYGAFLNTLVDFFLICASVFTVIKLMNTLHLKRKNEVTTKTCPACKMEIPVAASKCGHCCSEV